MDKGAIQGRNIAYPEKIAYRQPYQERIGWSITISFKRVQFL